MLEVRGRSVFALSKGVGVGLGNESYSARLRGDFGDLATAA